MKAKLFTISLLAVLLSACASEPKFLVKVNKCSPYEEDLKCPKSALLELK